MRPDPRPVQPSTVLARSRTLCTGSAGAAAGVFEGGGVAEGTANQAQVDVLYRQIGQLKVENDFLARKLGK